MRNIEYKTCEKVLFWIMILLISSKVDIVHAQSSSVVIPSNISTGSLEKNMLFYANNRYTVSQQGAATVSLQAMFDGSFNPSTTIESVNENDPTVILIEGLPNWHTQQGAWIGWSSRVWFPTKFKIEIFNSDQGLNAWVEVAFVDNYTQKHYMVRAPGGVCSKIRFTFYKASGSGGKMQLSELFYIHPEGARAYDGLLVRYNQVGNVGIGTNSPTHSLEVNGTIRAKEVKLEATNWPDYVFERDYQLMPLEEVKSFIVRKGHLPSLKSAKEYDEEGVNMLEMNQKLLEKIEELTLYTITQEEKLVRIESELELLRAFIKEKI
ncbi:hypothetical protein MM239_19005 [Belliella sp. DSM 111904]|uniref:Chaperone of endosialidase n=1 Tax=Belliella filtrata TaxID=2923435 RepID=A0ABS9V4Z7_9BACT|nr:hypothetical protein [Belliella filtrata]MCH7411485.1 hypothetical protein [Belliella filtrata]